MLAAALVTPSSAQVFGHSDLDINNIRARINAPGDLFWDFVNAQFEAPQGSGLGTLFAGNIWIGGLDTSGQLHLAAQTYRQTGADFFQGPMSTTSSYSSSQDQYWNRVWKINKSTIDSFRLWYQDPSQYPGYVIPQSISSWPAHGNTTLGEAADLAPFFDHDNNSTYDPANGDFPCIQGDQAIYFIFNDHRDTHTETGGLPLGVEVHGMAYAFKPSSDTAMSNTIFIKYNLVNRSGNDYLNTYIGNWTDVDLGSYLDDYMGSDVGRSAYYVYNGDNNDSPGYGIAPPAQAVVFLRGPEADPNDGIDNDRNGIIDEFGETWDLSKFVYYNNNYTSTGNPVTAADHYNYLKGIWLDGNSITYGGTGYNPSGIPSDFMFPGSSDPSGWGTGQQPQAPWDEMTSGNTPGDRRGIGVYGPFTFSAGERICLDYAYVYSRSTSNMASVTKMQADIDHVQEVYDTSLRACECNVDFTGMNDNSYNHSITIYPNPANSFILLDMQKSTEGASYVVIDATGREVLSGKLAPAAVNTIWLEQLSTGIYIIKIADSQKTYTKLISKQ